MAEAVEDAGGGRRDSDGRQGRASVKRCEDRGRKKGKEKENIWTRI